MQNISFFGTIVSIFASNTFPVGLIITDWADDADPIDVPSLQIADSAMGNNGDLIGWGKANQIKINLSVIPQSFSDLNLAILLEANRVGRGKLGARDIITMAGLLPNGSPFVLTPGIITDGMPLNSGASSGRLKTKTYSFSFENKTGGL